MNHPETRMTSQPSKAVTYARVSSAKQVREGHGLTSQETRCREFARHKGYEVIAAFQDDITGKSATRPGLNALLDYLKSQPARSHVVIIDDISRLARDVAAHIELRASIGAAGGILQSPSIEFGEDSDSILVENLLASVSQHQRQKNAEQVVNRMSARVMNGYWCFCPPVGYRYKAISGQGKMLVRDEPRASIVAEAIEGFASRRFETQSEVKRFLERHPDFPRAKGGEVRIQQVRDILTNPVYAGYVHAPKWKIALREGRHEALVSAATLERNKERIEGKPQVPARADVNKDFPLRGFVACGDCGHPYTGGWSRGRSRAYAYYTCHQKGCASYRKSVAREKVEEGFVDILKTLRPRTELLGLAREMLADIWEGLHAGERRRADALSREIAGLERQIDNLTTRVLKADKTALIALYEDKLTALEDRRTMLRREQREARAAAKRPGDFQKLFRTALGFLENPLKLWESERLDHRRALLKMAFSDRILYDRREGFRTAKTTLPFKVLADFFAENGDMVPLAGLEPARP